MCEFNHFQLNALITERQTSFIEWYI